MLSICCPVRDTVSSQFAYRLAFLTSKLSKDGINFRMFFENGSILPNQRTRLVQSALQTDDEYILFLDSDMIFPPDIVSKLIKHNADIVACNYSTRTSNQQPVAFTDSSDLTKRLYDNTGVHSVHAVGMGIMLIKTSVFKELPTPWFTFSWNRKLERYEGEDLFFCNLARSYGYDILVDADTSNACAHEGTTQYRLDQIR